MAQLSRRASFGTIVLVSHLSQNTRSPEMVKATFSALSGGVAFFLIPVGFLLLKSESRSPHFSKVQRRRKLKIG